MSDNITIKELLDLNESIFAKMSDITLEATVKEARQAYERKVKSGKREGQPFWSQKLTINDGTGDIVVDFIANKAEETIPRTTVGKRIRVEDAKTDIYKDERRLARGKVFLLESAKQPAPPGNNGYETLQDGRTVISREVWEKKDNRITRVSLAMKYIETGKTFKQAEKDANKWVDWIYQLDEKPENEPKPKDREKPKEKPEEKSAEKDQFDKLNDPNFNRDKLIQRLGKRFAELFVSGKTKGLGLGEWLTKNYQVESFLALSDDYLVEIDSVFDDMEGEK